MKRRRRNTKAGTRTRRTRLRKGTSKEGVAVVVLADMVQATMVTKGDIEVTEGATGGGIDRN